MDGAKDRCFTDTKFLLRKHREVDKKWDEGEVDTTDSF
jgi:hypothetical protein